MKKIISMACVLSVCAGCSTWPEEGRGGWAELYHPNSPTSTDGYLNAMPFQVMNEYDHVALKLDWLKGRGIKACMPGQLYQAELMLNRINRTLAAEMYSQAQLDLRIFYHQIEQLENHFERVIAQTECANSKQPDAVVLDNRILELLNSDNQFAFDSFKVTPKYMTRLAQAAELLKMASTTQLLLVGHTDVEGSKVANFELAYKRAEQVKHWLSVYGVKPHSIQTLSQGEQIPFEAGVQTDELRHSARRVNAYIVGHSKNVSQLSRVKSLKEWTHALEEKE